MGKVGSPIRNLRVVPLIVAFTIVLPGCSKVAAETPYHDKSYGFTISVPSSWRVTSGHPAALPTGEEITLASDGLLVTILIGGPPDETSMPKMLREAGWMESAAKVGGVPALSYIPPATDRANGLLSRIEFADNGTWYDLQLKVGPMTSTTKALTAFGRVVGSWEWDEPRSSPRGSSSGSPDEPSAEPADTVALALENEALGQVVVVDQDILSRFEQAWAQAALIDWVQVARVDRGVNLTQRLKNGDSREFWLQYGTFWFQGKPYTGDLLRQVWNDLAMKLCTSQSLARLFDKSSSVSLAAIGKIETAHVSREVMNRAQLSKLKGILSQLQVLGIAEDEYPSGYQRPDAGYELRFSVGEQTFTMWVVTSLDRTIVTDLWGYLDNPVPLLTIPGIYEWAASILPSK